METINIIFSSDDKYAPFLGVTLCSIFENKKCLNTIDIYVLDGGILEDNKNKLGVLVEKYHFKINYIKIDTFLFKDFYISYYFTQATYYRIIIPDLFPNLKKALYLDCDTIILGDLYELYNINIDNYFLAAVEEDITDRQKELGMPRGAKYFNVGTMLINLNKWREFNASKKIINFIKENKNILKFYDQDAINVTMWDKWLNIPFKYNYTSSLLEKYPTDYDELEKNILIIHYTWLKPWNYSYTLPIRKKYFYYLGKTPWKNKKYIDKNLKNILIRWIKNIILFLFPNHIIIKKLRKLKKVLVMKF